MGKELSSSSYSGLNVSATHSIIAAIMGFSLVWGGPKAVNWVSWGEFRARTKREK